MGLLSTILLDQYKQSQARGRAEEAEGLLGQLPQQRQIMPAGDRMSVQVGAESPGSGFFGSDQGPAAMADLQRGLLGAGYSGSDAAGMLAQATSGAADPTAQQQNFAAYQGMGQPQRDLYEQFRQSGAANTTINMGAGAGTMWTPQQIKDAGLPTGSVVTTDKSGKPQMMNKEKYTQVQNTNATFALRMNTANDDLATVMGADPGFDPTSLQQHSNKLLPNWMANPVRDASGQSYRQAQENWISANLRKESGAVLGAEEIESEMAKWFPAFGDSQATIKQKTKARKDAELGMQRSSGGAYQELMDLSDEEELRQLRAEQ